MASLGMLDRLRDVEAAVRRFRWFGALFLVAQIGLLYSPPPGTQIPFPRGLVALPFAVALIGLNLLSLRLSRTADLDRCRRWGYVQIAADTLLVAALIALFSFDPVARLWPLFVLPVLEGAMRDQTRGAVLTAVAAGAADTIVSALLLDWPLAEHVATTGFRTGILLAVAVGAGALATRFESARQLAEEQAGRLRDLALLSRAITAPGSRDDVVERVLETAISVAGAVRAEVHLIRGEDLAIAGSVGPQLGERASLLATADIDREDEAGTATLVDGEVSFSVLALPLVTGEREVGALVLAAEGQAPDREVLALLAAHAAVALEGARVAEAELRTLEDLREVDELRREFVHLLAHELGQPLMGLRGYADLLRGHWETISPKDREEFLTNIGRATTRLGRLVQDVEAIVTADARDLPYDPRDVELAPVVDRVLSTVTPELLARIEFDLPSDLPAVRADPDRLEQVLSNLLSNAMKYSLDGAIEVAARVAPERDAEQPRLVEIRVQDHGFGIAPERRERIFDRDFRLPTPEVRPGQGFGLYLTRRLVQAMGGTISVESEEGRGSTFRFTLPAATSTVGSVSGAQVLDVPRVEPEPPFAGP